jgi:hypothetical protein
MPTCSRSWLRNSLNAPCRLTIRKVKAHVDTGTSPPGRGPSNGSRDCAGAAALTCPAEFDTLLPIAIVGNVVCDRIAAHIANDAKHFVVTRHNSITRIDKARVFNEDVFEEGVFYEPVLVQLTSEEAVELDRVTIVEVEFLASKLLDYWRSKG